MIIGVSFRRNIDLVVNSPPHNGPPNPVGHLHTYDAFSSLHSPPFKQGLGSQGVNSGTEMKIGDLSNISLQ